MPWLEIGNPPFVYGIYEHWNGKISELHGRFFQPWGPCLIARKSSPPRMVWNAMPYIWTNPYHHWGIGQLCPKVAKQKTSVVLWQTQVYMVDVCKVWATTTTSSASFIQLCLSKEATPQSIGQLSKIPVWDESIPLSTREIPVFLVKNHHFGWFFSQLPILGWENHVKIVKSQSFMVDSPFCLGRSRKFPSLKIHKNSSWALDHAMLGFRCNGSVRHRHLRLSTRSEITKEKHWDHPVE